MQTQHAKKQTRLRPAEHWQFGGHLGQRINQSVENRIRSDFARKQIYPETQEAFQLRMDDRSHTGRGVWRGEFWGKWILSAIAAYRYDPQDDTLKQTIADAVTGLLNTQDDNGYIGTYQDSCCAGKNTWNIWCRKYTLWALLEAAALLDDATILQRAEQFCDHLISEFGPGQSSIIQTGQFCGLPSTSILGPVVKLYRQTQQQRYLDFALHIVDQWQQHPMGIPDILRKGLANLPIDQWFDHPEDWAKSYELISCVEGMVDLYEVTGHADYLIAARNIHHQLVTWERSPVGSVSYDDKFIGSRFLKNTLAEICDAVYWNRLSYALYRLTADVHYLDEMERTLYNTLLCGMRWDGKWGLRRLRLSHQHIPAHKHFLEHHQCCVANLPRGYLQAAQSAMMYEADQLYMGLYNESAGRIICENGQAMQFIMTGDFLAGEPVTLQWRLPEPKQLTLNLRVPHWCKQMTVKLDGQVIAETSQHDEHSQWFCLQRTWQKHQTLTIAFKLAVRTEPFEAHRIAQDDPRIRWHEQDWCKRGFILEQGIQSDVGYNTQQIIRSTDIQPHTPANVLMYGPLVLARDVRMLSRDAVFGPLDVNQIVGIKPAGNHEQIWKTYDVIFSNQSTVPFCDFSSAGNTWGPDSLFNTWVTA